MPLLTNGAISGATQRMWPPFLEFTVRQVWAIHSAAMHSRLPPPSIPGPLLK